MDTVSRQARTRQWVVAAQQAITRRDWAEALQAAGLAILHHPDDREPFELIARVCVLVGDLVMGQAYLRVARSLPPSVDPLANTSPDDEATFECLSAQWQREEAKARVTKPAAATKAAAKPFRLLAGGDVMLGRQMPGWVGLRGPRAPLQALAPLIQSADLTLVNLETCISTEGDFLDKGERQPYYYHNLPEMLDVLTEAGIGCVATANNHAMDFGPAALAQQIKILDQSGFLHFGSGLNWLDAALPKYTRINGVTVALIGVETETPCMAAQEHAAGIHHVALKNLTRVLAGSIAVARAHADLVIVSPHWGANWAHAPTTAIQDCARQLIALGADAVIGHSAHILQGVEFHAGRPIVYDMGTLLFDRVAQHTMKDAALFELAWDAQGGCRLTLRPVKLANARANWAVGEDFQRICGTLTSLSKALAPAAVIEPMDGGLSLFGQPAASPMRQLAGLLAPASFTTHTQPQVPAGLRQLTSHLVYATLPDIAGIWKSPVRVNPDLEVLGARLASPVRPGRGFVCEVYFRASAPEPSSRIEARLAALTLDGQEAFAYTHPVAEGIHPPTRWRFEDIICDRIVVRPVKVVAEGHYELWWSLRDLESGKSMPVVANHERLLNGRVHIGTLVVSEAAPHGVAGVTAPLPLTRAIPLPGRIGGWHKHVRTFWQNEAGPWVTQTLRHIGVALQSPEPVILRDGPSVLLLRIDTPKGAYFFKALASGNHFEPGLVALLAEKWPDRVTRPLAVDVARAWMLTPDHGVELKLMVDPQAKAKTLESIAVALAEIQIDSCARVDQLLAMGVPDRRLHLLAGMFEQLLADDQALSLGASGGLQHSERLQARRMLPTLRACCTELARQPLSAGLDHGDLHPGNVLIKDGRAVLFDWDTAWVTHPFCSLLLPYHARGLRNATALAAMSPLGNAYLTPWAQHTGRSLADLTLTLHAVLWVAHVQRAVFWSTDPKADEKQSNGERQTLVAKWIRLWLARERVLMGNNALPELNNVAPVMSRFRPSRLATNDNPLLLDKKTIARITGGTWHNVADDVFLTGVSFNRKYLSEGSAGNLYFPLNTQSGDETFGSANLKGVERALGHGAAAVVVPRGAQGLPAGLPLLQVGALFTALETMALHVRDDLFKGKRVLVTGTEGKTGFKCMLHHVLAPQISTHAITNSSNFDRAIHASLASIRTHDQIAILEAAGTHPGHMARRSQLVKPHMAVITEVGNEHINFHGSQQAVIGSKADIVTGLVDGGYGLLNADSKNYEAVRQAVLSRRRVPLLLFGSKDGCQGRLRHQHFENNTWIVNAVIEGQSVEYQLPVLGDHAPLASVSVLLAAYYLGADVVQAATEFVDYQAYESQGVLRRIAHRGGEISCYDNSSRASVLSYQSTLRMAAHLTPPTPQGKKIAVIGQMIFLGNESEAWHATLAEWVDEANFDRVILVGKYTEVTFAHLRNPNIVVRRFPDYDRRYSDQQALQALIHALDEVCAAGDLLFLKGELDELGEYLHARQIPADAPLPTPPQNSTVKPAPALDHSVLTDLQPLTLAHMPLYRAAIDQTQRTVWQHYFPFIYLLGQSPGHQFLIQEDAGSVCLYLLRQKKKESRLNLFLLPMPMQAAVLERCIERVKAFNRSDRASLFRVDADDAKVFRARSNTRIVACPPEYIYAPANFLDMSGNKKRNLRRAIQSVQQLDGLEVLNYQTSHAPECQQVLEQWASLQQDKYGQVQYGGFTQGCLEQYDQFPRQLLFGKVIRLGGKICSFGFAGEMRQGMGNLFITYSDLRIDGLNKFLYYQLLLDMSHLKFANASHAGDTPGLAFAKQALGPAFLCQPYQVYAG